MGDIEENFTIIRHNSKLIIIDINKVFQIYYNFVDEEIEELIRHEMNKLRAVTSSKNNNETRGNQSAMSNICKPFWLTFRILKEIFRHMFEPEMHIERQMICNVRPRAICYHHNINGNRPNIDHNICNNDNIYYNNNNNANNNITSISNNINHNNNDDNNVDDNDEEDEKTVAQKYLESFKRIERIESALKNLIKMPKFRKIIPVYRRMQNTKQKNLRQCKKIKNRNRNRNSKSNNRNRNCIRNGGRIYKQRFIKRIIFRRKPIIEECCSISSSNSPSTSTKSSNIKNKKIHPVNARNRLYTDERKGKRTLK